MTVECFGGPGAVLNEIEANCLEEMHRSSAEAAGDPEATYKKKERLKRLVRIDRRTVTIVKDSGRIEEGPDGIKGSLRA